MFHETVVCFRLTKMCDLKQLMRIGLVLATVVCLVQVEGNLFTLENLPSVKRLFYPTCYYLNILFYELVSIF